MKIPKNLDKYIVNQNEQDYTPEDQAVWRYIMRQLVCFLSKHAHSCYLDGLKQTRISINKIPLISNIDKGLQELGWRAVPVSGFIPPAVFMEFQAHSILPIASQMRSFDHILYTPAPDIVHEAAGHAPILINKEYSQYLKQYAKVASSAIVSSEDIDLYEAIRFLSDIKESPESTPEDISRAEDRLKEVTKNMTEVSEATLLGRMNWWTAEYGLIGPIESPKIFGAGLLSSMGESQTCLSDQVRRNKLELSCIDQAYNITEPQPQLFVTPSFSHLKKVLLDFEKTLSFHVGGSHGLKRAKNSKTINTVKLNSGLQMSGLLSEYFTDKNDKPIFVKFSGPTQLCYNNKELSGHGKKQHSHGYSNPLGTVAKKDLSQLRPLELQKMGIKEKSFVELNFDSGIKLYGKIKSIKFNDTKPLLLTFVDCRITYENNILFSPEWGEFDLAPSTFVESVSSGAADPSSYGALESFVNPRVPKRSPSEKERAAYEVYSEVRKLRDAWDSFQKNISQSQNTNKHILKERLFSLVKDYQSNHSQNWLIGLEILEIHMQNELNNKESKNLTDHLKNFCPPKSALNKTKSASSDVATCVESGLKLASFST